MNNAPLLLIFRRLPPIAIIATLCLFLMICISMPVNKSFPYASTGLHQNLKKVYSPLTRVPPVMAAPALFPLPISHR